MFVLVFVFIFVSVIAFAFVGRSPPAGGGTVVPLVSRFDTGEYQVALLNNTTCALQYFSFTVFFCCLVPGLEHFYTLNFAFKILVLFNRKMIR